MKAERKLVITGASGFLGTNLLQRVKGKEDFRVLALSSRPGELREKTGGPNIRYEDRQFLFEAGGKNFLREAIVVNCAFPRNAKGTGMADGLAYIQRIFERSAEDGARAVINLSSQSVYASDRTEPATEGFPVCLETPYAVGKYAAELLLESICSKAGIVWTNIRLASLIGPNFDQRVVNRMIRNAWATGEITADDSRQSFGFFDVEDAVSGLLCMLDRDPAAWAHLYNLSGNRAFRLLEIAQEIACVFREKEGRELVIHPEKTDKTGTSAVCAERFYRDFGFAPQVTMQKSILRILQAVKSQREGQKTNGMQW